MWEPELFVGTWGSEATIIDGAPPEEYICRLEEILHRIAKGGMGRFVKAYSPERLAVDYKFLLFNAAVGRRAYEEVPQSTHPMRYILAPEV